MRTPETAFPFLHQKIIDLHFYIILQSACSFHDKLGLNTFCCNSMRADLLGQSRKSLFLTICRGRGLFMNKKELHSVWRCIPLVLLIVTNLAEAKQNSVKINGVQLQMAAEFHLPSAQEGITRVVAQFDHSLLPQERQALQDRGIRFERYLSASAYIVSGTRDALNQLAANRFLSGIALLPAEAKIDAVVRAELPQSTLRGSLQPKNVESMNVESRNEETTNGETISIKVLFQEDTPYSQALEILQKYGAALEPEQTGYNFHETIDCVTISNDRILPFANEESVLLITEVDPPIVPCNINAQDTSNIDEIHPGGLAGYDLDGTGVTVGLWDPSGVRTTHSQLIGRATQEDGALPEHFHSTHVAGTIAASGKGDNRIQGMAPNASLLCWDCNNHLAEMDANAYRIVASNHSYTYSAGRQYNTKDREWYGNGNAKVSPFKSELYGRYATISQSFDQIVYDHDLMVVVAAGNNRVSVDNYWGTSYDSGDSPLGISRPSADGEESGDGYDTLNTIALGKNIITVGAIHDRLIEPPTPELDCIASWSSWGPTDDGRIKPDLVANGVKLLSLDSDDDTSTRPQSGTSMAAPVVTGTIACLVQQYRQRFDGANPSSAIIKNILLHTAQDQGTPSGPDYRIGWGLLDARAAADFIQQIGDEGTQLEINAYEGSPIEISAEYVGKGPIKVTMVWTDPPGAAVLGGLDDSTPVLVNDLDLSIADSDELYYPWTLDPANPSQSAKRDSENHCDNVEQVYIARPSEGPYTIRIGGQINWGASQIFTLCISGLRLLERETKLLIFQPTGQRRMAGVTPIHLFATSNIGILESRIELDGQILDNLQTAGVDGILQFATPQILVNHRFLWDTTQTPNGEHRLSTSVRDASGQISSKEFSLFILNESDFNPLILDATPTLQELSSTNDRDWFTVQVPDNGFYTIETHPVSNFSSLDTEMVLYGPDDKNIVIQEDDDGGIETYSRITYWLKSHRSYYVRVGKYNASGGDQSSGLYTIDLTQATQGDSEPSIELLEANGPIVEREILDAGEVHWFRFITPYLGTYILEATPVESNPASGFQFELFKPEDTLRSISTGNYQKPIFRVLGENLEYRVKASAPKSKGQYTLSLRTLSELSIYNLTINGPAKSGEFHTGGLEEAWYVLDSPEFTSYLMEFSTESSDLAASTAFILFGPDDPSTEIVHTETKGETSARMFLPLRGNHNYFLQVFTRKGNGSYTIRVRNPKRAFPLASALSSLSADAADHREIPIDFFTTPVAGWMLY